VLLAGNVMAPVAGNPNLTHLTLITHINPGGVVDNAVGAALSNKVRCLGSQVQKKGHNGGICWSKDEDCACVSRPRSFGACAVQELCNRVFLLLYIATISLYQSHASCLPLTEF